MHGSAMDWDNVFHFYSDGKWYDSQDNALYADYYCNNPSKKDYYLALQKEEYSEWDPGIKPIRIDQCQLQDGTPIYLVYAETYSDMTWHHFSYTAFCIKDGRLLRYPLFEQITGIEDIQSDILIIGPASIDFDFTLTPSSYEYEMDRKIIDTPIGKRVLFDSKNGTLKIVGGLSFQLSPLLLSK